MFFNLVHASPVVLMSGMMLLLRALVLVRVYRPMPLLTRNPNPPGQGLHSISDFNRAIFMFSIPCGRSRPVVHFLSSLQRVLPRVFVAY